MPSTLPEQPTCDDAPQLMLKSYGLSDQGRQRSSNEDRFVIAEFARNLTVHQTNIEQPRSLISSHRVHVFLVADGVGGSNAGEIASAISLVTVEEFLLNTLQRLISGSTTRSRSNNGIGITGSGEDSMTKKQSLPLCNEQVPHFSLAFYYRSYASFRYHSIKDSLNLAKVSLRPFQASSLPG